MINLNQDQRVRVKADTQYLRQMLEDEVHKMHSNLESCPLDKVLWFQGRIAALKDVIELLP